MNFLSQLTGSFSQPCAENPTVAMVEAAYRDLGIDWRYINCEVAPENLADAVRGAKAMGWAGFNCSIPHKVAVIEHLDALGESAALMQAVNCVVIRDGKLIGENTDGKGFVEAVRPLRDPRGASIVLFGAGGAARAIAVEMSLAGVRQITIVNRDPHRGTALCEMLQGKLSAELMYRPWESNFSIPAGTDIVVNATSIGLAPNVDSQLKLDWSSLHENMLVADVIPNPPRTHLVRTAEARGCTTVDGLGMLVNQGVIGIRYWTGRTANPQVMRACLERIFGV
jgi:shikimate dehydrogenase